MKISVVTISYNQGKFLKEAIESVFNQSHKDIEYIIIDAGSTDNSRFIIDSYKDKFTKIIYEPDKGPAHGLNKGLELCTGDIFCYINADDRFVPNAFSYVDNFFKNNLNIDGIIGAAGVINAEGKRRKRRILSGQYTLKTILSDSALALQQATFLKLDSLRKYNIVFNINNTTAWDAELLIDLCLKQGKLHTVDKTLGEFRIYPDSITGSQRLQNKHMENKSRLRNRIESLGYNFDDSLTFKKLVHRYNIVRYLKGYLK